MANRHKNTAKSKSATGRTRAPRLTTTHHSGHRASPRRNRKLRASPQPEKDKQTHAVARRSASAGVRASHEALAVALWCAGLLSLLALATYDADDASLNASGNFEVGNWIGPAGAYWADLLLQGVGIGAFAMALGLLLAGWRAFVGKRIMPGFRESAGTLLLVVCVGAFAHICLTGSQTSYPAGGILGAILGGLVLEQFARVGGYILSGALVLLSLALAADGILTGLGLRGLSAVRVLARQLHSAWLVHAERRRRLAERRAEIADVEQSPYWTFGAPEHLESIPEALAVATEGDTDRRERIDRAIARGRRLGDAEADREDIERKRRAVRDVSEPAIQIDSHLDLAAEDEFDLGDLPVLDPTPGPSLRALPPPPHESTPADSRPGSISIRAAAPELRLRTDPPPSPEGAAPPDAPPPTGVPEAPAAIDPRPKRLREGKATKKPVEPEIVDVRPEIDIKAIEKAAKESAPKRKRSFQLPSPTLLNIRASEREEINSAVLRENAVRLTKTLKHYGIDGVVREIRPGPVITMYEFVPAPGTKISKIASLADDLAMSMEALRVRIVAPIPGRGAVGIEIPNEHVETVFLKELITHKAYRNSKGKLPIALGKDIEGTPCVTDLTKMPHLLVAGATGAGKSVSINAMVMSMLFNSTPEDVRMIMVDPKMLELSVYEGIPHLLLPVVTDPKKAAVALRWAVMEMERRYQALSGVGVRNIAGYNNKVEEAAKTGEPLTIASKDKLGNVEEHSCEHLPYIVIIVDELADLMMVASREVEASIMRLAQMARAAGIHLILATQRPSVDVLTGVIKANFPTRIAFQVASKHDSRTILDTVGAEHLLGRGDMLFVTPGAGGIERVHGSFVGEEEIQRTVDFVKEQGAAHYDESILSIDAECGGQPETEDDVDDLYDQAVAIVTDSRQASISMIQRRLRIGYNRAARLVENMEREGIVGPADGSKPREVLALPAV